MRKTAVVYWSGTGNTQMMAEKVAEGVRAAGAEADVYNCTEFSADLMDNYEAVAFAARPGAPSSWRTREFERCLPSAEQSFPAR